MLSVQAEFIALSAYVNSVAFTALSSSEKGKLVSQVASRSHEDERTGRQISEAIGAAGMLVGHERAKPEPYRVG